MKKSFIRILMPALLFVFVCNLISVSTSICVRAEETVPVEQLVKNNGKYYYYDENGQLLKSSWKKMEGKNYYFTAKGAAATGCVRIEGRNYLFNSKGILQTPSSGTAIKVGGVKYFKLSFRKKSYYVSPDGSTLMPGAYCPDNRMKFIFIGSSGAYNAAVTKKLNQLAKQEAPFSKLSSKLASLHMKAKRKTAIDGCYAMKGKRGQEWFLDYRKFSVHIFKCTNGSSYVLGIYDAFSYQDVLSSS